MGGLSFSTVPGPLFAAGYNANGQLGSGGTSNVLTPTGLRSGSGVFVAAAVGGYHSLGLRADGTVWAWGANLVGGLGNGSTIDAHSPVQVPALSEMVAVAAGGYYSLSLRSDGTVWAWGTNSNGQLGNGNTTEQHTPVQVQNLSNVVAIAAGEFHSLALRSDGTVWAWGYNGDGQLGNGTTTDAHRPVQVSGLSPVVAIAAGLEHSLALLSDGTVWAWGSNSSGQLGNGLTTNSSTPVQVSQVVPALVLASVVGIAAGGSHSLALLSSGIVRTWGSNSNGQLGNGTTTNSLFPLTVSNLTGVTQIAGGDSHSLAIDSSGRAWAWGANSLGQLGNGTFTDEPTPVQVEVNHGAETLAQGSSALHTLIIGQPYASLNATVLTFVSEPVGSPSSSQTETVTNNGIVPLQIGQAAIVGSDGDEFTMSGDGCSGTTVPPGGTCTIGVRFDPKVTGTPAAILRITSNGPTSPDLVTLDPPAYKTATTAPTAHIAAVQCGHTRLTPHALKLTCALASTVARGNHRLTIRLTHGKHTIANASGGMTTARTISIRIRLHHSLKRGAYHPRHHTRRAHARDTEGQTLGLTSRVS
jgi:alpha-tubulin suppressor-like RCC1 family protein